MADLIAIGYDDETTGARGRGGGRSGSPQELIIQPDAVAVIVRDKDGKYKVTTNHHMVGGGATWGMFWGLLFGLLFFVPGVRHGGRRRPRRADGQDREDRASTSSSRSRCATCSSPAPRRCSSSSRR